MKVGIVLLLSLLCVAQALPLSLNEKDSHLTRGKRHDSRSSKNIADKEVRTIISAIVDAILDGDRKKRSEIPEEEDDGDDNDDEKNEVTESGSGINEETAVLSATLNNSKPSNQSENELFKSDIIETGSGSGDNTESGSGLNSDGDLNSDFAKRTDTEKSATLPEEANESSSESESGSGDSESESGEAEDEMDESGDASGDSGSGSETDFPEESSLQPFSTEESRAKRDEGTLDHTKTNIMKHEDPKSNESEDLRNDSGSGSGFGSGTESGDSNNYELDIRNGQLEIDSSKTTTKEKRSFPLTDKNRSGAIVRLDDNIDEDESSSGSGSGSLGSGSLSGDSSSEVSGSYSGDVDATEISKSKRSLTQGDEDEFNDGESGSGLESGSGQESGDESGSPWDDGSGFSFDKRTKLTINSANTKEDFSESGSESATEDEDTSKLTKTSKGEDGDGDEETVAENNQYKSKENKDKDDMNELKTVNETEAKVPKISKDERESEEEADDNKNEYDSEENDEENESKTTDEEGERNSSDGADEDDANENKQTEYIDGSDSDDASGGTEASGSGQSGSGQYSHEKKTKIIREIVTDMAKAAVDAVEVDDNDRVVKKSEMSVPDVFENIELEKLKPQNSHSEAITKWKPLNEDSIGEEDRSNVATKKATLETYTKNNEMNEALKDLVKSILRDDPTVHSSIQQLSKKREEDEEKLYRDIFDLVQHEPVEPEDETKEKVITEVKDFEGLVEALSQTETLSPGKHELIARKLEKDLLNHLRIKEREDPLIQQQEDELLKDSELSFVKDKIDEARESAEDYALKHFGNLEEIRKHAVQSLKPIIESLPLKREDIEGLVKSITKSAWVKMITHTKMKPNISSKLRRSLEELFSID